MNRILNFILTITLTSVLISSCIDKYRIANSDKIFKEEIAAYNDILNEIVDTTSYFKEMAEHNGKIAVFFLFDTLISTENRCVNEYPANTNYIKALFEKRQFWTGQINGIKNYKFIRATKYPKDTIIAETLHVLLQDSLKIEQGEWFTGKWLEFSRICFNSEMTKGYLSYYVWCGNSCSWGDNLEIEKINGKWKVTERYRGPVS